MGMMTLFRSDIFFKKLLLALFLFSTVVLDAKPFIVGKLIGQLGNQLFQIAATVSLAMDHDAMPVFPDLVQSKEFNIPLNHEKVFFRLNTTLTKPIQYVYDDPKLTYNPIPYHPDMSIQGWFQCEKYFRHHKKEILELFAPSKEISDYLENTYGDLLKYPKTVAVHHRSYLREDPYQKAHPTQKKEYFAQAIMLFPEDSIFIVCSNDIEWCKKAFADIPRSMVYVEGEPHYHDLYLMSKCKHNIIANSSFSWWSAYMNENPDKIVIAPKQWFTATCGMDFRDIVPKDWIILE